MRRSLYALAACAAVFLSVPGGSNGVGKDETILVSTWSRVTIYDTAMQMAADSDVAVVGEVTKQWQEPDIDGSPMTISAVRVQEVIAGSGAEAGRTVTVRQEGTPEAPYTAKILTEDKTYLLFLTLTGLGGDLATQYFTTGATAGIYATDTPATAVDGSTRFEQVEQEEGEPLPLVITLNEMRDEAATLAGAAPR